MNYRSVNEIFGDVLINRAPDKMIEFVQGFVMLAYQDHLVYFNVNKYGVEDDSYIPKDSHENFVEATITDEHIRYLDLHRSYKIICIQEIGNEMDALVLEDLRTRQIRFLRVFYTEMEDKSGQVHKRFKLV